MNQKTFKNALTKRVSLFLPDVSSYDMYGRDDHFTVSIASNFASFELMDNEDSTLRLCDIIIADPAARGSGTGRLLMGIITETAQNFGFKKIELEARMVGAYAWAKAGFTANLKDVAHIIEDVRAKIQEFSILPNAENVSSTTLWKISDSVQGKELLKDQIWRGELDFENVESMSRFKKYTNLSRSQLSEIKAVTLESCKAINL
jgi:GNAT superfamily N-acetyltransferase